MALIASLSKISKRSLFFLFFTNSALFSAGSEQTLFEINATKYLLGTKIDITVSHSSVIECKRACYFVFKEIERIESLLSSQKGDSEISKINNMASQTPVHVSFETYSIISRAILYSKKFDGFFDISIGPVTELWGFNGERKITIPSKEKLNSLKSLVDYNNIFPNIEDTTISLGAKGMKIDLGGIAKGYAVDRAAVVLKEQGILNFIINAGGDIYASGHKSEKINWLVGIKHPRKSQALLAKFELRDYAVATSGDYERYADIDGKRYHHIINPKTGYPVNYCQSVTVFASSVEAADAWATYLFIIGYNRYQTNKENAAINSIFVNSSGEINFDKSLERDFLLTFLK